MFLLFLPSFALPRRTPAAFEIADANASVSNISFPDEDLDVNEVGGRAEKIHGSRGFFSEDSTREGAGHHFGDFLGQSAPGKIRKHRTSGG